MHDAKSIWILCHNSYLPEDGPHIRHYCFGKYLGNKGYRTTVFTSNQMHHSNKVIETEGKSFALKNEDGVSFAYVKCAPYTGNGVKRVISLLSYYFRIGNAARTYAKAYGKPDVIYASTLFPTAVTAGLKLAKRYGVKCVCETRDIWPEGLIDAGKIGADNWIGKALRAWNRRLYEKADALVFTMPGGLQYIRDMGWDTEHGGKIPAAKVTNINNGVDLSIFDSCRERCVVDDADLEDASTFKVVYTGSIRYLNNMPLLLETAKCLRARNIQDIKLLLWGDGNYLETMRRLVQEEGLANIAFKGRVDKARIPYIISKASLNIIAVPGKDYFKYGNSQNKMFEYLAAGKPILATGRMNYSIIVPNGAGVELNACAPEDVADAILRFKNMPKAEYQAYCARARAAASQYDYKVLAEKLDAAVLSPMLANR